MTSECAERLGSYFVLSQDCSDEAMLGTTRNTVSATLQLRVFLRPKTRVIINRYQKYAIKNFSQMFQDSFSHLKIFPM